MIADLAAARIEAPADTVFAFITDPQRLDLWSVGTWRTELRSDGLIEGWAMATGARILVRIDPLPERRLVDYHIGQAPDALAPRIHARVIPGPASGHGLGQSTLLLTALRSAEMDDARWQRLRTTHAFEVDLVKSLIETGHDHRVRAGPGG